MKKRGFVYIKKSLLIGLSLILFFSSFNLQLFAKESTITIKQEYDNIEKKVKLTFLVTNEDASKLIVQDETNKQVYEKVKVGEEKSIGDTFNVDKDGEYQFIAYDRNGKSLESLSYEVSAYEEHEEKLKSEALKEKQLSLEKIVSEAKNKVDLIISIDNSDVSNILCDQGIVGVDESRGTKKIVRFSVYENANYSFYAVNAEKQKLTDIKVISENVKELVELKARFIKVNNQLEVEVVSAFPTTSKITIDYQSKSRGEKSHVKINNEQKDIFTAKFKVNKAIDIYTIKAYNSENEVIGSTELNVSSLAKTDAIYDYDWFDKDVYTGISGNKKFELTQANQLAAFTTLVNGTASTEVYEKLGLETNVPLDFAGITVSLNNDVDLSRYGGIFKNADGTIAEQLDGTQTFEPTDPINFKDGWEPIGDRTTRNGKVAIFSGIFDGKGNAIYNLAINVDKSAPLEAANEGFGLFGTVSGSNAKILNLGVENVNITQQKAESFSSGGLVGYALDATISNCYVIGNIHAMGKTGLFAGFTQGTRIDDSMGAGNVSGTTTTGGFIGWQESKPIKNCFFTGNVTATSKNADSSVGGFVGYHYGNGGAKGGVISNSYATGTVRGDVAYASGFAGQMIWNLLSNNYAAVKVENKNEKGRADSFAYYKCLVGNTNKESNAKSIYNNYYVNDINPFGDSATMSVSSSRLVKLDRMEAFNSDDAWLKDEQEISYPQLKTFAQLPKGDVRREVSKASVAALYTKDYASHYIVSGLQDVKIKTTLNTWESKDVSIQSDTQYKIKKDQVGSYDFTYDVLVGRSTKTKLHFERTLTSVKENKYFDYEKNSSSAVGTKNNPYLITTPLQLKNIELFGHNPDAYFKLAKDIDLKDEYGYFNNTNLSDKVKTGLVNNGVHTTGWDPIGSGNKMVMQGKLDGDSHSIYNLSMDSINGDGGLFYTLTDESEIKNLNIINAMIRNNASTNFESNDATGILAKYVRGNTKVSDLHITGSIYSENSHVGAIAGNSMFGEYNRVSAMVNIVTTGDNAGGFFGKVNTVAYSILGNNTVSDYCTPMIKESFFTGNIQGNNNIGGLIGSIETNLDVNLKKIYSQIQNNYVNGYVKGNKNVGGFIGNINTVTDKAMNSLIYSNYSTMITNGNSDVYAFSNAPLNGNVVDSTIQTERYTTGTIAKSTKDLIALKNLQGDNGFDIEKIWELDAEEKQYPGLKWVNESKNPYVKQASSFSRSSIMSITDGLLQALPSDLENDNKILLQQSEDWTYTLDGFKDIDNYSVYFDKDQHIRYEQNIIGSFNINVANTIARLIPMEHKVMVAGKEREIAYLKTTPIKIVEDAMFAGGNGSKEMPYLISTVSQLDNVRLFLNNDEVHFRLKNDIDLKHDTGSFTKDDVKSGIFQVNNPKYPNGWIPLGNEVEPFLGSFDGAGNVIKNMTINSTVKQNGLFGYIGKNATIENVGILNARIRGVNETGALAGRSLCKKISDVYVVDAKIYGSSNATGGLIGVVGSQSDGIITHNIVNGSVEGIDDVGGMFGINSLSGCNSITESFFTGSVKGRNTVGGFIGQIRSADQGALVPDIKNNYTTATVTSNRTGGGFFGTVGITNLGTKIENNYSASYLNTVPSANIATENVYPFSFENATPNNYFDSSLNIHSGNENLGVRTNELKSELQPSMSDSIWKIDENKNRYPSLKYFEESASTNKLMYKYLSKLSTMYVSPIDPVNMNRIHSAKPYSFISTRDTDSSYSWTLTDGSSKIFINQNTGAISVGENADGNKSLTIAHKATMQGTSGDYELNFSREIPFVVMKNNPDFSGGDGASKETAYEIRTPQELYNVRYYNMYKYYFKIMNDIDMRDFTGYFDSDDINEANYISTNSAMPNGWEPISWYRAEFKGDFNGNNKSINNLAINKNNGYHQSLFGYTKQATIYDLNMKSIFYNSGTSTGGLVGTSSEGTKIKNCHIQGRIKTYVQSTGGIVGQAKDTIIENSSFEGEVSGSNNYVGGIIGNDSGGTQIKDVSSKAFIKRGNNYIGGIAGNLNNGSSVTNSHFIGEIDGGQSVGGISGNLSNASIKSSYSYANIKGWSKSIGGLVGVVANNSKLQESFSMGNVSGLTDVGGVVGGTSSAGILIENCYGVGKVSGSNQIGGFIGFVYDKSNTIRNNYVSTTVYGDANNSQIGAFAGTSSNSDLSSNYFDTTLQTSVGSYKVQEADFKMLQDFKKLGFDESVWENSIAGFIQLKSIPQNMIEDISSGYLGLEKGNIATLLYSKDGAKSIPLVNNTNNSTWSLQTKNSISIANNTLRYEMNAVDDNTLLLSGKDEKINGKTIPIQKEIKISVNTHNPLFAGGDGSLKSPFEIATPEQLAAVSNFNGSSIIYEYKLIKDIDLSQYGSFEDGVNSTFRSNHADYPNGWKPIAEMTTSPFTGNFDGNGHRISNMAINAKSDNTGLFGVVSHGTIKNLIVSNANVASRNSVVGILAGKIRNQSVIENCQIQGNIRGEGKMIGGIVGLSDGLPNKISHSFMIGNINGNQSVGGLLGESNSDTGNDTIINSFFSGNLRGQEAIGGLVAIAKDLTITSAYATGSIVSNTTRTDIGGIVGSTSGTTKIADSYSAIQITTSNSKDGIYAIAGPTMLSGNVSNTYYDRSINHISKTFQSAGLVTKKVFSQSINGFHNSIDRYPELRYWTNQDPSSFGAKASKFSTEAMYNESQSNLLQQEHSTTVVSSSSSNIWNISGSDMYFENGKFTIPSSFEKKNFTISSNISLDEQVTVLRSFKLKMKTITSNYDYGWFQKGEVIGTYEIRNERELAALAELVNGTALNAEVKDNAEVGTYPKTDFKDKTLVLIGDENHSFDLSRFGGTYIDKNGNTRDNIRDVTLEDTFVPSNDDDKYANGWIPIGKDSSHPFRGIVRSSTEEMVTIKNLVMNDATSIRGLFGIVDVGVKIDSESIIISNINIEEGFMRHLSPAKDDNQYCGLLIGRIFADETAVSVNHRIENIQVSGNMVFNRGSHLGGVVGESSIISYDNVHSNVSITSKIANYVGGITGRISGFGHQGAMANSSYKGDIRVEGGQYYGGIAGVATISDKAFDIGYGLITNNSYAIGSIIVDGDYAGGLYALYGRGNSSGSRAEINNSFASVKIQGGQILGGLLGEARQRVTIQNSYASGSIVGNTGFAGFIAVARDSTVQIKNCYTSVEVNRNKLDSGHPFISNNVGATLENCYYVAEGTGVNTANYGATAKTQKEMLNQMVFIDTNIWKANPHGYPQLVGADPIISDLSTYAYLQYGQQSKHLNGNTVVKTSVGDIIFSEDMMERFDWNWDITIQRDGKFLKNQTPEDIRSSDILGVNANISYDGFEYQINYKFEYINYEKENETTYLIRTANELNAMRMVGNDPTLTFKLVEDIDLKSYGGSFVNNDVVNGAFVPTSSKYPSGWEPINKFTANFDGNNKIIKNLASVYYQQGVGFFGSLNTESYIHDVGIVDAMFRSSSNLRLGIFAGEVSGEAKLENIYTTGSISNGVGSNSGGVIGYFGDNDIAGSGGSAIGLFSNASIYSKGTVAGGLVGYNNSTIRESFFFGNVQGASTTDVGGLIGQSLSYSVVTDCYANANVQGVRNAGGFIGHAANTNKNNHRNNYSTSMVSGNNSIGAFQGTGSVINGLSDYKVGLDGRLNRTLTNEMLSTDKLMKFEGYTVNNPEATVGFDVSEKGRWMLIEDSYPQLRRFVESKNEVLQAASKLSTMVVKSKDNENLSALMTIPNGTDSILTYTKESDISVRLQNMENGIIDSENGTITLPSTVQNGKFKVLFSTEAGENKVYLSNARELEIKKNLFSGREEREDGIYFIINSQKELESISELFFDFDYNYVLGRDIVLDVGEFSTPDDLANAEFINTNTTSPNGWKGIQGLFTTFDGNSHTISEMNVNSYGSNVGLFRTLYNGAKVKNTHIEEAKIRINNDNSNYGLIAGRMESAIIENCIVTGDIYSSNTINSVGGLVGSFPVKLSGDLIILKNNIADVNINLKNTSKYSGGLFGGSDSFPSVEITNNVVSGTINAGSIVGGLGGFLRGSASFDEYLIDNFVNCDIKGNGRVTGFLNTDYLDQSKKYSGNIVMSILTNEQNPADISSYIKSTWGTISVPSPSSTNILNKDIQISKLASDTLNTKEIILLPDDTEGFNKKKNWVKEEGHYPQLKTFTQDTMSTDANEIAFRKMQQTLSSNLSYAFPIAEDNTNAKFMTMLKNQQLILPTLKDQQWDLGPYFTLDGNHAKVNDAVPEKGNSTYITKTYTLRNKTYTQKYRYQVYSSHPLFADGAGTIDDPFQIKTAEHLNNVRNFNGMTKLYYIMMNDIDLTSYSGYFVNHDIQGVYQQTNENNPNGWVPIGDGVNPFYGDFDGQNHLITGLAINTDATNIGLFGQASGSASIKNVGIVNGMVRQNGLDKTTAGLLIGRSENDVTKNCFATGSIISKGNIVGGLIGQSMKTIEDCFSAVNVEGYRNVGGFTGFTTSNVKHTRNFTSSIVNGNNNVGGYVGGFDRYTTFENCYASSDVTGENSVGGFGGASSLPIGSLFPGSYATSTINLTNSFGSKSAFVPDQGKEGYYDESLVDTKMTLANGLTTSELTNLNISSAYEIVTNSYPRIKINAEMHGIDENSDFYDYKDSFSKYSTNALLCKSKSEDSYGNLNVAVKGQDFLLSELSGITWKGDRNITIIDPPSGVPYASVTGEFSNGIEAGITSSFTKDNFTLIRKYTFHLYTDNPHFSGGDGINKPFEIRTVDELDHVRDYGIYKNLRYELMNDIDLNAMGGIIHYKGDESTFIIDAMNATNPNGWIPLSSKSRPFKGSFEGNNFVIKNMSIFNKNTDGIINADANASSLFGYVDGGAISNLGIKNANVFNTSSTFMDSSVTFVDERSTGILAGTIKNTTLLNVYSEGSLYTKNISGTGGLVGNAEGSNSISNSFSVANVFGNIPGKKHFTGGLIGRMSGTSTTNYATLKNAYFSGSVNDASVFNVVIDSDNGYGGYTGSLLGYVRNSNVSNAYATANISGNGEANTYLFSGYSTATNYEYTYDASSVSRSANKAVAGSNNISKHHFYDYQIEKQNAGVGTGLPTNYLQTFRGMNEFNKEAWTITPNNYPQLKVFSEAKDIKVRELSLYSAMSIDYAHRQYGTRVVKDSNSTISSTNDAAMSWRVDGTGDIVTDRVVLKKTGFIDAQYSPNLDSLNISRKFNYTMNRGFEGDFSSGIGSSSDPYKIRGVWDFDKLRDSKNEDGIFYGYGNVKDTHYEVWEPIDMTEFKMIPDFGGNMNFAGRPIMNLNLDFESNPSNNNNIGIFQELLPGAVVSGATIVNAKVSGINNVGIIAGVARDATITECVVNGEVSGENNVGGFVGLMENSDKNLISMDRCVAGIMINGTNYVGGLYGNTGNIRNVTNSYASGTVTVNRDGDYVGGLFGNPHTNDMTAPATITNYSSVYVDTHLSAKSNLYATGGDAYFDSNLQLLGDFNTNAHGLNKLSDFKDVLPSQNYTFSDVTYPRRIMGDNETENLILDFCSARFQRKKSINNDAIIVDKEPEIISFVSDSEALQDAYGSYNLNAKLNGNDIETNNAKREVKIDLGSNGQGQLGVEYKRVVRVLPGVESNLTFKKDIRFTVYAENPFFEYGDGSIDDPFQIWNLKDLNAFGLFAGMNGYHFIMKIDLDMRNYETEVGKAFLPIRNMATKLDGNYKVIYNLTLYADENMTSGLGFFVTAGGGSSVHKLGFINANVDGSRTEDGTKSEVNDVGILAGNSNGLSTKDVFVQGSVKGHSNVGGLIGNSQGAESSSVFTLCDLLVTGQNGGNLFGNASGYNGMENIYTSGTIRYETKTLKKHISGFIGNANDVSINTNTSSLYSNVAVQYGFDTVTATGLEGVYYDYRLSSARNQFHENECDTENLPIRFSQYNKSDWDYGNGQELPRLKSFMSDKWNDDVDKITKMSIARLRIDPSLTVEKTYDYLGTDDEVRIQTTLPSGNKDVLWYFDDSNSDQLIPLEDNDLLKPWPGYNWVEGKAQMKGSDDIPSFEPIRVVRRFEILSSSSNPYFASGDGTKSLPYVIKDKKQLENMTMYNNLSSAKTSVPRHFKLANNIDMDYDREMLHCVNEKANWVPTKMLNGSFDGNGNYVYHLRIDENEEKNSINDKDQPIGFFQELGPSSKVSKFGIEGNVMSKWNNVGLLAGKTNEGAIIDQCVAYGSVKGKGVVGGLIGEVGSRNSINNSYAIVDVEGEENVSGFIGNISTIDNTITNSYVAATLKSNGTKYAFSKGTTASETNSHNLYDRQLAGVQAIQDGEGTFIKGSMTNEFSYLNHVDSSWTSNAAKQQWQLNEKKESYPQLNCFNTNNSSIQKFFSESIIIGLGHYADTATPTSKIYTTKGERFFESDDETVFKVSDNKKSITVQRPSVANIKVFDNLMVDGRLLKFEHTLSLRSDLHNDDYQAGGKGTEAEPYKISNEKEFDGVFRGYTVYENTYYQLQNDLNFNTLKPIESFTGHFDGNYHVISYKGLDDDFETGKQIGLISNVTGTAKSSIKKLGVFGKIEKNVPDMNAVVGLLVGKGENLDLSEVFVSGTVKLTSGKESIPGSTGLLAGELYNSKVQDSYASGHLALINDKDKVNNVAGYVGKAKESVFNNVYIASTNLREQSSDSRINEFVNGDSNSYNNVYSDRQLVGGYENEIALTSVSKSTYDLENLIGVNLPINQEGKWMKKTGYYPQIKGFANNPNSIVSNKSNLSTTTMELYGAQYYNTIKNDSIISKGRKEFQYHARDNAGNITLTADGIYYKHKVDSEDLSSSSLYISMEGLDAEAFYREYVFKPGENIDFAGGHGTLQDPYIINKRDDLSKLNPKFKDYAVTPNVYYSMVNHIDLNPEEGNISAFRGYLDGGGYNFNNLKIQTSTSDANGFFKEIKDGATIKNLGFTNALVSLPERNYVGILAGKISNASIENVALHGNIQGKDFVGGATGKADNTSINGVYSMGLFTGRDFVGGLVGEIQTKAIIENSYSMGILSATMKEMNGGNVGGLVGRISDTSSKVRESYFAGGMSGNTRGAIAGVSYGDIYRCYFDELISGANVIAGAKLAGDIQLSSGIQTKNLTSSKYMLDKFTDKSKWTLLDGIYPQVSYFAQSVIEVQKQNSLTSAIPTNYYLFLNSWGNEGFTKAKMLEQYGDHKISIMLHNLADDPLFTGSLAHTSETSSNTAWHVITPVKTGRAYLEVKAGKDSTVKKAVEMKPAGRVDTTYEIKVDERGMSEAELKELENITLQLKLKSTSTTLVSNMSIFHKRDGNGNYPSQKIQQLPLHSALTIFPEIGFDFTYSVKVKVKDTGGYVSEGTLVSESSANEILNTLPMIPESTSELHFEISISKATMDIWGYKTYDDALALIGGDVP